MDQVLLSLVDHVEVGYLALPFGDVEGEFLRLMVFGDDFFGVLLGGGLEGFDWAMVVFG